MDDTSRGYAQLVCGADGGDTVDVDSCRSCVNVEDLTLAGVAGEAGLCVVLVGSLHYERRHKKRQFLPGRNYRILLRKE